MQDKQVSVIEKESPPDSSRTGWGARIKNWFLSFLSAFAAGLVGGLVSIVCMLILRLEAGIPTPVELFGDFFLKRLPAVQFVHMLIFFGTHSKTAPLGLTLLSMLVLGCLLGLLYATLVHLRIPVAGYRPGRREWLVILLLGLALSIVGTVLFWTEIRQNFLGLPVDWSRLASSLGLLLDFEFYALALGWCYRALLPKERRADTPAHTQSRRALLARSGVAVLGVGATAGALGLIREYLDSFSTYDGIESPPPTLTAQITPNSEHYVVTQNPIDPSPSLNVWRLEITGMVEKPGTYTYEEFTSLPSTSRAVTLECIANGIGGRLISTAVWQGVTFSSLLERHGGAKPGARYVAFYSVDGYTISQPLEEVLKAEALLAFRMNGAELPVRHGYPVRALIPGHYGEENPKWLTRVELIDHFVGGLYSDQGWYNGPLHTIARIDTPYGRVMFQPILPISGFAFAGYRGIQKVEVSTDNGTIWHDAQLAPPLSKDTWVLWTYQWRPEAKGLYTLVARATDGTGQVQTAQRQGTTPGGATGYHMVQVNLV